ncbi:hypothetical protein ACIOD2_32370 [Amycolatopsis sp. NPDC088138]|uniref:hypothetical protein n=1 Tax=Amycolatopsis sp. NPDC088138 TaxID=3363938 RepID=UPI0038281384
MRVTMKASVSGSRDGQSWPAIGETVDLPDEEAVHLCGAGIAAPAGDEDEAAVVEDDTEKATTQKKPQGRPATPPKQQTKD